MNDLVHWVMPETDSYGLVREYIDKYYRFWRPRRSAFSLPRISSTRTKQASISFACVARRAGPSCIGSAIFSRRARNGGPKAKHTFRRQIVSVSWSDVLAALEAYAPRKPDTAMKHMLAKLLANAQPSISLGRPDNPGHTAPVKR